MSRNYAAELAEYAALVAKHPDVGWHLAILDIRVANDIRPAMINVALCESYLLDWLSMTDETLGASVSIACITGTWFVNGGNSDSRLLALIAAVEATKPDAERGAGDASPATNDNQAR